MSQGVKGGNIGGGSSSAVDTAGWVYSPLMRTTIAQNAKCSPGEPGAATQHRKKGKFANAQIPGKKKYNNNNKRVWSCAKRRRLSNVSIAASRLDEAQGG